MQRGECDAALPQGPGRGVESVAPKSEAFRAIFLVSPVIENIAECRWRREEWGGMTETKFESLQLKIIVK